MVNKKNHNVLGQKMETIRVKRRNIEVVFLNYGARIYELKTPDLNNNMENIVLAYHDFADYVKEDLHLNATLGPIAGRLNDGEVCINGQCFNYSEDAEKEHVLHGGTAALSYHLFESEIIETNKSTIVRYKTDLKSQVNHHANSIIYVTYEVKDSAIVVKYQGETDQLSYLNLSNHFYFNLSGNVKFSIHDQMIRLKASNRYHLDESKIPLYMVKVEGLYDFNQFLPMGKVIDCLEEGLDDVYLLDSENELVFEAYDPKSCRYMSVSTSYEACVLYTHNVVNAKAIKPHNHHLKHHAFCVEFQNPPYHLEPSKRLIDSTRDYSHVIEYHFKTKKS